MFLVLLSLGLLLLLWPRRDEAQLFPATRSACAKYKTMFLELCALVYILCAGLSLYARFRAKSFRSNVMLVLLREQAITSISYIDLIACGAIVVSHLTGHHDICERIHRRVWWFLKQLHRFSGGLCDFFSHMLQEPDLERQSLRARSIASGSESNGGGIYTYQGRIMTRPFNGLDGLQERFRYLRTLSMSQVMHQELSSMGAQLRWTRLRDHLLHNQPPMQDFFSLAASQARVGSAEAGRAALNAVGPTLPLPPRNRTPSIRSRSPSLSIFVSDIMKLNNLNSHNPRPSGQIQHAYAPSSNQGSPIPTPVFQLPGTIETICVKALPDTGSSKNVIDKNLVESLFPTIPVHPVYGPMDNLLVAPDGQPILCIGKIMLSWMFKDENEKHSRWFYVVENCSKGVIIGNGFLRETETMSKHRRRLELTKPSDPHVPPRHLLSEGVNEARRDECLRQLVLGCINATDTLASLDTGCEANLMSIDWAKRLELPILDLPTSEQHVKYADGRRGSMLGQVEVDWSFSDTPDKATKVIFYVLKTCVHPVIFGQRFIFSEDPWCNHEAALRDSQCKSAMVGVVGLEKRRFWGLFGSYKPDPQEEQKQREKKSRKDKAAARLESEKQAQSGSQPQQQLQVQVPAVPQPAVLAPSNQPSSP